MTTIRTYKELFKMPKPVSITGRSSSITNSFVNAIIPVIQPTNEEIEDALKILGMDCENYYFEQMQKVPF